MKRLQQKSCNRDSLREDVRRDIVGLRIIRRTGAEIVGQKNIRRAGTETVGQRNKEEQEQKEQARRI